MDKKKAHFEALGYEPLRMKPAHFASGFFISLTDEVYSNELLNKVAVIKANKGLLKGYTPEAVTDRLRCESLILDTMTQAEVEMLRVQVNGVVNNDAAMYPAFNPYRAKGNDYTFISPRVLTKANRTDGFAGHFVATVLAATDTGRAVIDFARRVSDEPPGTLERFVNPLLPVGKADESGQATRYKRDYGDLEAERVHQVAHQMQTQSEALARLCKNLADYSHYRQIRYIVLGLLAWLMSYVLRTAAVEATEPVLLFDFLGMGDGPIRSQSQTCYSRVRDTVGHAYRKLADAGRFSINPIESGVFKKGLRNENDFRFLEQHFGDLALRMGYAQPRASRVPQKHFEFQPDTLRALMLSILDQDVHNAIRFDEVCDRLRDTWSIVIGGSDTDATLLRQQGYFGFDEVSLQHNAAAFAARLESLNLAVEPSDGLILCSKDVGAVL